MMEAVEVLEGVAAVPRTCLHRRRRHGYMPQIYTEDGGVIEGTVVMQDSLILMS